MFVCVLCFESRFQNSKGKTVADLPSGKDDVSGIMVTSNTTITSMLLDVKDDDYNFLSNASLHITN